MASMKVYYCKLCHLNLGSKYYYYKHLKTHPKKSYQCSYCDQSFGNRTKYKAHQLDIHQVFDDEQLANASKCDYCQRSFSTPAGQKRHMKSCSLAPVCSSPLFPYVCHEEYCEYKCSEVKDFVRHLEGHGLSFPRVKLSFENLNEFQKWKEKEEMQKIVNYILSGCSRSKNYSTFYYKCNRSGYHVQKMTRKRNLKKIGSCKLNHLCTSKMVCKLFTSGEVQVIYQQAHYGHNLELAHLRMRPSEKTLLRAKLMAGVKKQKLISDSKNFPGTSRVSLLTRKQLTYLETSCPLKESKQCLAGTTSVQAMIEKMEDPMIGKVFLNSRGKEDTEHQLDKDDFPTSPQMDSKRTFKFLLSQLEGNAYLFGNPTTASLENEIISLLRKALAIAKVAERQLPES